MNSITVDLPFPPSANRIWRSNFKAKKVHLEPEYEKWMTECCLLWLTQKPRPFQMVTGPFWARIVLVNPDKRRRDLDNRIKVLLDFAQKAGIVEDDSNTSAIDISWGSVEQAPTGCRVVINPGERKSVLAEPSTPGQELYARGRDVLGAASGGLITKLLKLNSGVVPLTRAVIEVASTKNDPAAYVGAVVHQKSKGSTLQDKGEAW